MFRVWAWMLLLVGCAMPGVAQDASPLTAYFVGKQVGVKQDMPGTQKGVDLSFNKSPAMDWNEYSSRIKTFGVAIPKGTVSRVTKFVVKKDMIEFQLDGGGFGTAGDDSNTTVSANLLPKSQYEKDLEKQIAATSDARKKRDLQADLDHERGRRERLDQRSRDEAMVASQMKAQQVMQRRLGGGSRFNLRWKGAIPSDTLSPDGVMRLLAEYIDFSGASGTVASQPPMQPQPGPAQGGLIPRDAPSQLRRGMRMDEVEALLGRGRVMSQSTSGDGMRTQTMSYVTQESTVSVMFVEGVVVRYSISSN